METFTVNYDDQLDDAAYSAISAANNLLKEYGLKLTIECDNQEHDGWNVYEVKLKKI